MFLKTFLKNKKERKEKRKITFSDLKT